MESPVSDSRSCVHVIPANGNPDLMVGAFAEGGACLGAPTRSLNPVAWESSFSNSWYGSKALQWLGSSLIGTPSVGSECKDVATATGIVLPVAWECVRIAHVSSFPHHENVGIASRTPFLVVVEWLGGSLTGTPIVGVRVLTLLDAKKRTLRRRCISLVGS